jgi:hypothetical protein
MLLETVLLGAKGIVFRVMALVLNRHRSRILPLGEQFREVAPQRDGLA